MNQDPTADFSILPAHIVTQILRYLKFDDFKNASSVCKSWYYASTDPQIVKTLTIQPSEDDISQICRSNRKYGILKLQFLDFDREDRYYFELFEKIVPFVNELHIIDSDLKIHHLLKLFELTRGLEVLSLSECSQLVDLPGLFPSDFNCELQDQIVTNLSGVKQITIEHFINIPFIAHLVRCATKLQKFEFNNEFIAGDPDTLYDKPYQYFFTIFDNDNTFRLTHLDLHLNFCGCADDFITSFVSIRNLNLRSLRIVIWWVWAGGVYKSSLFRQLILKLQSLNEFSIYGLGHDQLSIICKHLVNLKNLDCLLGNDQPISELANLKHLEKLRCRFSQDTSTSVVEIDTFFKSKFENLRLLNFEEFVTEQNLTQLCENHPNLLELKLTRLVTRNLEIIFRHLTKLRVVVIYFDFSRLNTEEDGISCIDSNREYEFKISRLQDLEEFYLCELVNGIHEDDVRQLKKLRLTNLLTLFGNKENLY